MALKYTTKSAFQTKNLGRDLAEKIIKDKPQKRAVVFGLTGNLGGGKTTFIQGLARGFGVKEKILSPTFIIMRKFKIPAPPARRPSSDFRIFYHIDCYRTKNLREILDLGFKKILANPSNIIAIEWAGNIKRILPKNVLWLQFNFIDKNTREIMI